MRGVVVDSAGEPIVGARVTVVDPARGFERVMQSGTGGAFELVALPPGGYVVTAEELGFRPHRMTGVAVFAGQTARVVVPLAMADPPVERIDTTAFPRAGVSPSPFVRSFARLEFGHVVDRSRDLTELARFTPHATGGLEMAGLPAALGGVFVDGVAYRGAQHPWYDSDPTLYALFPLMSVERAELVSDAGDIEWSGFGGGWMSAGSLRGASRLRVQLWGDWAGDALASSDHFGAAKPSFSSIRGGLAITGPILRDTAAFAIGFEGQRDETPLPVLFRAPAVVGTLGAALTDSLGLDAGPFLNARVSRTEVLAFFARFDWQIARGHFIHVRGNVASVSGAAIDLGSERAWTPTATLASTQVSVAGSIASQFRDAIVNEFRVGVENDRREYDATGLPGTMFTEDGAALGTDGRLPARVERTGVRGSETLHFLAGSHHVKIGIAGEVISHHQEVAPARAGVFTFQDPGSLLAGQGAFQGTAGSSPLASFTVPQIGVFLQDAWQVVPGFDFQVGLRYEWEFLPTRDVLRDTEWLRRTGLANDSLPRVQGKFSPRVGFSWDVGQQGRWIVTMSAGAYQDMVDPGALGELVQSGRVAMQRAFGNVGSWPALPSTSVAPAAALLTLFGPDFESPRTSRAVFGITRTLGRLAAAHFSTTYRHTDFLPRRQDLNLLPAAAAADQHGRPLYGELQQAGSVLGARPASNRRFAAFDVVSALDPDGFSNYWDVSVGFETRMGPVIELVAGYTYSRTTDNWLSGRRGGPDGQRTPFPDSLAGRDWADGRSDFDLPHRLTVGATVRPFGPGRVGIGVVYRYRSGYPYTPGFRAGVDINADGSGQNDPAFVDDGIAGIDQLLATATCLRTQVGRFAERNACREPGSSQLDLRFEVGPLAVASYPVRVVIDALNVLDAEEPIIDGALYTVDPTASVVSDPTTGTVTVPLVVNPAFGEARAFRASGRSIRLGLRVNY